jgi:hypothetical protein
LRRILDGHNQSQQKPVGRLRRHRLHLILTCREIKAGSARNCAAHLCLDSRDRRMSPAARREPRRLRRKRRCGRPVNR